MTRAVTLRSAQKVTIHCPISAETLRRLTGGDLEAIERDPAAAAILAVIRASDQLGDFDLYKGVFEVSLGLEGFTSTERANPTSGQPGERALSPTAIISTYVDPAVSAPELAMVIDALVLAHPWETPVIEVGAPIQLVCDTPADL